MPVDNSLAQSLLLLPVPLVFAGVPGFAVELTDGQKLEEPQAPTPGNLHSTTFPCNCHTVVAACACRLPWTPNWLLE
jgi:hypothetical protein